MHLIDLRGSTLGLNGKAAGGEAMSSGTAFPHECLPYVCGGLILLQRFRRSRTVVIPGSLDDDCACDHQVWQRSMGWILDLAP